ncbi:hypothetical protein [Paraburkholderia hospita]|uniref:hypothetical protein n=1 Tax=Paraburkholderia hospita TaxID=169430 RepID=UPI001F600280|nr:hypothetical protein [Paraburkholderia hospita]
MLVAIDGSDSSLGALRVAVLIAPLETQFKIVYAADDNFVLREWLPIDVIFQHGTRLLGSRKGNA